MSLLSYDSVLDACGLFCPEPIMLLHQKIASISLGQVLLLKTTDPTAKRDIERFCEFLDHNLLDYQLEGEVSLFWIQKK